MRKILWMIFGQQIVSVFFIYFCSHINYTEVLYYNLISFLSILLCFSVCEEVVSIAYDMFDLLLTAKTEKFSINVCVGSDSKT